MTITAERAAERHLSPDRALLIRGELDTVLQSESFASSQRCRDFLDFVVNRTLAEDYESLTERFLGVRLFGRAVDYETATDSIVRVRANDVRRRLIQHYSTSRPESRVRIELVPGGYVPEFRWSLLPEEELRAQSRELKTGLSPGGAEIEVAGSPRSAVAGNEVAAPSLGWLSRRPIQWGILVAVIVAAALIVLVGRSLHRSNFDAFWQPVLDAPGQPLLNLPTTDTFQLTKDSMRTLAPLSRLQPGQTLEVGVEDVIAFHDWHVSMPVLQGTMSVALALDRKGKPPLVRIGTDLRRDELRGHPIIAIGSFSNPWTEQNVSGLRFTFDRGADDREAPRIRDSLNPQRSWSLPHTYPQRQDKDYAIITRTFDSATREPFVSLAGLHSFGNQVAGEFVAQESSWNEVARRAPAGWQKMNLQIVLEADIVGTTPGSPKIVDIYFWK